LELCQLQNSGHGGCAMVRFSVHPGHGKRDWIGASGQEGRELIFLINI